ncbi:hypothetical protein FACS1894176_03120 [Bacteroidia bacterium]|nr:hypothetical protein FACS1894176_03120 [Bacteroidia bacterium]
MRTIEYFLSGLRNKAAMTALLLSIPAMLLAQHTLQSDLNRFRPGDALVKQQVEYKNRGRSGENVLWDFSQLNVVNDEYKLNYRLPRANRHNQYVLGRDTFDVENVAENELLKGSEHFTQYYYRISGDTLYSLGYENATTLIHHTQPMPIIAYPFGYGQTIQQDYRSEGLYSSQVPVSTYGTIRIEADAYGKLLLPSTDTLNHVLRVKTIQTILENDTLKETGGLSTKMRVETCRWYSQGYRYPVFETIRSINLRDSVRTAFNTAFFYPPQEQYYLQDEANLAILDSLENENFDPWAGLTYNVFPNPVRTQPLNVELYLPQSATVRAQVRNTIGNVLIDKNQGNYPVGICNFQLNLQGLQTNNYILDIWLNDHLISYTIMKR